jgi:hypothetical protein
MSHRDGLSLMKHSKSFATSVMGWSVMRKFSDIAIRANTITHEYHVRGKFKWTWSDLTSGYNNAGNLKGFSLEWVLSTGAFVMWPWLLFPSPELADRLTLVFSCSYWLPRGHSCFPLVKHDVKFSSGLYLLPSNQLPCSLQDISSRVHFVKIFSSRKSCL